MYITYEYERDDIDGNRGTFFKQVNLEQSEDWKQVIWWLQDNYPEWYYDPLEYPLPSKVEVVLYDDVTEAYYNCIIDTEGWRLDERLGEYRCLYGD